MAPAGIPPLLFPACQLAFAVAPILTTLLMLPPPPPPPPAFHAQAASAHEAAVCFLARRAAILRPDALCRHAGGASGHRSVSHLRPGRVLQPAAAAPAAARPRARPLNAFGSVAPHATSCVYCLRSCFIGCPYVCYAAGTCTITNTPRLWALCNSHPSYKAWTRWRRARDGAERELAPPPTWPKAWR